MSDTTLPPLVHSGGFHGGYRLFGRDHISFDDGTARGWHTVTSSEWTFSTSQLDRLFSSKAIRDADDGKVTLHSYKMTLQPGPGDKHPLDGTKYDTIGDARRAAFDAGLLSFMVYEEDRA